MRKDWEVHIGETHNRLTITGIAWKRRKTSKWNYFIPFFKCNCSCGAKKQIRTDNVLRGIILSCGCARRELAAVRMAKTMFKHGHASINKGRSREMRCYWAMKSRCLNPAHRAYPKYGGIGLKVCRRWLDSFPQFLLDMGPVPSNRHSIDRIDNEKGYSPGNCRWATPAEQTDNRRCTMRYTIDGETKSLAQWAKVTGIHQTVSRDRIKKGWDYKRAIFSPKRPAKILGEGK